MKIVLHSFGQVFIVALIFLSISFIATIGITYFVEKERNETIELLGKKIVLDDDTSTITDYNLVINTYTLSSGKEIDIKLAKQILVK